jgi:hypothetical protein
MCGWFVEMVVRFLFGMRARLSHVFPTKKTR